MNTINIFSIIKRYIGRPSDTYTRGWGPGNDGSGGAVAGGGYGGGFQGAW